jgi:short-subunit dehydrogenase involved in D-alanine esterification of teichoic acids
MVADHPALNVLINNAEATGRYDAVFGVLNQPH